MHPRTRFIFVLTYAVLFAMQLPGASASDVIVGKQVPSENQKALGEIDHGAWDSLLSRYVNDQGLVNYSAWQKNREDVRKLDGYLDELSRADGQGTLAEKMAFWINAYNAVTIKGILREYPTSSIRNHTAKFFGYNIWKNLKLVVDGDPISLDSIEHEVLRKMGEPRIHFAIVCASIGCPRLLNQAYVAERLDEQLAENTRHFFSDPTKFRYDSKRKVLYMSPILKWFAEDFGLSQKDRLQRISAWIPDRAAARVVAAADVSLRYQNYDWSLNDWKQDLDR